MCLGIGQCDLQALLVFLDAIVHCEMQITRLKAYWEYHGDVICLLTLRTAAPDIGTCI